MSITIYALIDPRTALVRYIGQTVDPDTRLLGHETAPGCTKAWIVALKERGDSPVLAALQSCEDQEEADRAERKWIARFADSHVLLNIQHNIMPMAPIRLTLGARKLRTWIRENGESVQSFAQRCSLERVRVHRLLHGRGKRVSVNLAMVIVANTGGFIALDDFATSTIVAEPAQGAA